MMRVIGVVAGIAALLCAAVSVVPVSADEPQLILFGAHPATVQGQTRVEAATSLQTSLAGPNLALIRRYLRWEDDAANDPLIDWTLDQGSIPLISIVPIGEDDSVVTWDEIATATPGTPVHDELISHAQAIASLEGEVWFAFQHEPETVANMAHGEDVDFIAAYQRFVDEVRLAGGTDVSFIWVMTSYAFELPQSDRRAVSKWYPGDAWVDQIGADPYNWLSCRPGINNNWRSFESVAIAARDFAADHPDKGLVIAEFGSVEDPGDPLRKAAWVTDVRLTLREPGWEQLTAILTFHDRQPAPDQACAWWVDTSPESLTAYSDLINDELFGGTQGPPPVHDPTCVATLIGDEVQISWTNPEGTQVLRRNDAYLASVPMGQTSFVDANPEAPTSSYVLRLWSGPLVIDVPCGAVQIDSPSTITCTATATGAMEVELVWTPSPQAEIVRRNDTYLASPDATATSFVDSDPVPSGNVYTLRTWAGGSFTDIDCGTVSFVEQLPLPQCSAALVGDRIELTWSGLGSQSIFVFANGDYVSTVPAASESWSLPAPEPGTHHYMLRQALGVAMIDIDCGTVEV